MIKHLGKFLAHLDKEAELARIEAGMNGSFGDGGASRILDEISAYRAGREGKLPTFWVEKYNQFTNTLDPEYKEFLRLQKKFK